MPDITPLWSNRRLGRLPGSVRRNEPPYFYHGNIMSMLCKVRDDYEAERQADHARIAKLEEICAAALTHFSMLEDDNE